MRTGAAQRLAPLVRRNQLIPPWYDPPPSPIDLEASEAEKAALETRISLLKRERRRPEAELTRELAAAGKTPPPTSIMQQPSLVEAASSASASDTGPHHGPGPLADTHTGGVGQAAWSAADAPVTASRKRKRKGKAPAATAPTAAIFEQVLRYIVG